MIITHTTNDIARQIAELDVFDIRPMLRDELAFGIGRSVSLDLHADPHRCTLRVNGAELSFEMRGSLHITDRRKTEAREALITGRVVHGDAVVVDTVARAA